MTWPFRRRRASRFDPEVAARAVRDWAGLSRDEQDKLITDARVLADRLRWEAARGLTLDGQIVSTIAARAALLVLGRSPDEFRARNVVVHASTVVLDHERAGPVSGTRSDGPRRLHGQADDNGLVLLAWDSIERGGRDGRWSYDVVIHEFAHSLDAGDGLFDGTPSLDDRLREQWIEVATARFEALRTGDDPGVLRPYGATNTAEFFAVAVETLFDRPHALREADPEFHRVLAAVVGVDPAQWTTRPADLSP